MSFQFLDLRAWLPEARNWKLIAEAQRLLGKPEAALKAEEEAARLVRE